MIWVMGGIALLAICALIFLALRKTVIDSWPS